MLRVKFFAAMLALVIGFLTTFNQTARMQSAAEGKVSSDLSEQVNLVCTANPVVTSQFDGGPGSLRQAVAEACAGSTIAFNVGGAISLSSGNITIDRNLTIQGNGVTVQSVTATFTAANRIFYVNSGVTAAISGLTLKNGRLTGNGAGIYNDGTLTVMDVTITENKMIGDGGGIFNNGSLTVTNSVISNNGWLAQTPDNSSSGGGIFNNGTLTVTGTTISGNQSEPCFDFANPTSQCRAAQWVKAGGILNNGMLTITNSIFSGNGTGTYGNNLPGAGGITNYTNGTLNVSDTIFDNNGGHAGAIFNYRNRTANVTNSTFKNNTGLTRNSGLDGAGAISSRGTTNITGSTFFNNECPTQVAFNGGGAIFVAIGGTVTLTNSTVSNNLAWNSGTGLGGGGGIAVHNGILNIINSTVTTNRAGQPGNGGLGGGVLNNGTVNVRNSIIAGNTAPQGGPDYYGTMNSQGYNLIGNTANMTITGDTTGNIIGADARLAPLGFYGGKTLTHALLSSSPAVHAGTSTGAPAADQRGASRVSTTDIGAFELNNSQNGGSFVAQLPDGMIQTPYNYTLIPDRGSFTYSVTGGALPNGISLSTGGAVVSVNGTTSLSGVFNFSVTATDGTNSSITDYSIHFNAPTVSLSGGVTYGITPQGQSVKLVPNVLFNAVGTTNSSTTSNSSGVYILNSLTSGGNYTVTPSKTGNINGITSFDAALVMRCVAAGSACALTANQKIAADTDNDNVITAFDATLILRFVASNVQTVSTGQVGNWEFVDPSKSYTQLSDSQSNQNYTAFLLGEVDGDWNPAASLVEGNNDEETETEKNAVVARFR